MRALAYDALLLLGTVVMSLGVFGMIRMPDLYTKIHAASKAVVLGVAVLALAATVRAEGPVVMRLVLLIGIILLTTAAASAAIGRAGFLQHERMETPGAIDESGSHLANAEHEQQPTWRF